MPLFRRATGVPRDHRDELVAGALVGTAVIVLGYASGIGAPASGAAEAAPPVTPPAAPATTSPGAGQARVGSEELPSVGGVDGVGGGLGYGGGYGTGGGGVVTGTVPIGSGGGQGGGHAGHGTTPVPGTGSPTPAPAPTTPTPSPSGTDSCADGEVKLVQPLLVGVTDSVLGLLDGPAATPSPSPTASPCVGLAPASSLLGGILTPASASPQPEATP